MYVSPAVPWSSVGMPYIDGHTWIRLLLLMRAYHFALDGVLCTSIYMGTYVFGDFSITKAKDLSFTHNLEHIILQRDPMSSS